MRAALRLRHLVPAAVAAIASLAAPAYAAPRCVLAIVHARVIPMDRERVLDDRAVLIGAGRILAILPASAHRPACARTVDAAGGYLLPGLNDMHAHVETLALAQAFKVASPPIDYPSELALFLANGVTGVRVMSGAPDILAFRDRERRVRSEFPRLVVATPMLSGAPPVIPEPVTKVVTTPQAARDAVRAYKRAGYDFVKVRDNLTAPVFRAVIDEAKRQGLYVDGHVSQGQGLSVFDVLRSGQHAIAHLDNLQLLMTDKAHDPATYIALMHACGCFVETTLEVEISAVAQIEHYDREIARPEIREMNPLMVDAFWRKPNNPYLSGGGDATFFEGLLADEKTLLKAFVDADVHVVAGTDALNPMIIPGVSLLDELDAIQSAGLTPYQTLRTATANPAAYVPGFQDVGVLAPGRVANAVLVEQNPLTDLKTLRAPLAVMINAHWLTRADLHKRLDAAAARFAVAR